MEITTITVKKEIKERMKEFGNKGETYSEILERLIESARERQLHDLLMDERETVSIEDVLANARKR